ncbi:glycosyltransferase family protein [Thermus thalpophilus]
MIFEKACLKKRGDDVSFLCWAWFVVAFGVRFIALVVTHFYSTDVGLGGFNPLFSGHDDRLYYEISLRLLNGEAVPSLPNLYPLILAVLFHVWGPSLFFGKLINVLAGALGVGIAVCIAERLTVTKQPRWSLFRPGNVAGLFLSLYPSAVFYSTQLLKDASVWLLGFLGLYLIIRLVTNPCVAYYLGLGMVVALLWFFRPYVALALVGALGLYILFRGTGLRNLVVLGVLFLVIPWLLGWGPFGWKYLSPLLSPERLARFRAEVYGIGGSSLGIELDPTHPFRFLLGWLYSSATVFLGPFPWQVDGLMEAIAFLEVVYIWPLVAVWLLRLRCLRNPGPPELLLLFALILGFGIGIFSDNLGANTRLRLLVWGALIIYAAVRLGGSGADTLPHHPSRAGGSPDAPSGTP